LCKFSFIFALLVCCFADFNKTSIMWLSVFMDYEKTLVASMKFYLMIRTALGPTQPSIQWVPGALSLGVKWPGCEADQSPPSSAKVKE
jgi:hypothetical protein